MNIRLSCQKTVSQGNGKGNKDWTIRSYTKDGVLRLKSPRAKTIKNAIISINGDITKDVTIHKAKTQDLKTPFLGKATRMVGFYGKIKVMRTDFMYNTWAVYNPKLFN